MKSSNGIHDTGDLLFLSSVTALGKKAPEHQHDVKINENMMSPHLKSRQRGHSPIDKGKQKIQSGATHIADNHTREQAAELRRAATSQLRDGRGRSSGTPHADELRPKATSWCKRSHHDREPLHSNVGPRGPKARRAGRPSNSGFCGTREVTRPAPDTGVLVTAITAEAGGSSLVGD